MVDKDMVKAALQAVSETRFEAMGCPSKTECCCPGVVLYFIFTNCVTINNGACPDWVFCKSDECNSTTKAAQG